MKPRTVLRALAIAASLPLVVLAAVIAWRSIERLHTAYLFAQGRTPTDDLIQAQLNLRFEIEAWGFVLGLVLMVLFLLRFWYRSRHSNQEQLS
jgi:TRAP-type C4-dicarboxylate transport system permease small subunit